MKGVLPIIIICCFLIVSSSCRKSCAEGKVPECITSTIESNKNSPEWGIETVDEYEFNGYLVYVFKPGPHSADMFIQVLKDDCSEVCTLGGIMGIETCQGEKFYRKATYTRTIWTK